MLRNHVEVGFGHDVQLALSNAFTVLDDVRPETVVVEGNHDLSPKVVVNFSCAITEAYPMLEPEPTAAVHIQAPTHRYLDFQPCPDLANSTGWNDQTPGGLVDLFRFEYGMQVKACCAFRLVSRDAGIGVKKGDLEFDGVQSVHRFILS